MHDYGSILEPLWEFIGTVLDGRWSQTYNHRMCLMIILLSMLILVLIYLDTYVCIIYTYIYPIAIGRGTIFFEIEA